MAEKELKFRPVTEGLGFHPFSDGLPYAPVSKHKNAQTKKEPPQSPYSMGTGAVSAGDPVFSHELLTPPRRPHRVSTTEPQVSRSSNPISDRSIRVPVAQQVRSDQPQKEPDQPRLDSVRLEPHFGFLYLLKRLMAYSLDSALNISLCVTALSFALLNVELEPTVLFDQGILLLLIPFALFFNWALITAQEVAFNTSVGKRIFGLSLEGSATAIFLRSFFFLPSVCFVGVGLLWALFSKKKRCWHDMVVDLQPKEVAIL